MPSIRTRFRRWRTHRSTYERGYVAGWDDNPCNDLAETRDVLRRIKSELGVPGDDTPAPVANAVALADSVLPKE